MNKPQLERTLSLFSLVMMGMGMMIGAGVFVASGISIAKGGSGSVIIAFTLNGLIALFTAMSYAELASAIPRAGGPYNWASFGLGKFPGFLTGWMEWLAAIVAGSLYAITFAAYTVKFVNEGFGLGLSGWELAIAVKASAVAIALVFVYINYRGASETGAAAVIMAAGQMITLAAICVAAFIMAGREPERFNNFREFIPAGWDKVLVAMGLTYVAFEGFEVICQAGDEAIDPKRNIPKALFYSLVAVVVVYVLLSLAMTIGVEGGSPMQFFAAGGDPSVRFSDSVKNIIPFGGLIVTIAVIFSATSALNSTIYSATRISFAMGRDKFLPRLFSSIVQKTRIPGFALFVTSLILLTIAIALPIEHVAAAASVLFLFVFMIGNIAVIVIRKDMSDKLKYGYIMPFFPFLTLIAIFVQFAMMFKLFEESNWTGPIVGGWVLLGGLVYFFYSKSRAEPQTLQVKVLETKHVVHRKDYSVLVPVSNPNNVESLIDRALAVTAAKDGEIVLLNFIHIPDQSPMEVADRYLEESRKTIDAATAYIGDRAPVNTVIKYGRDFYKSVMNTIKEYDISLLIMGWRGSSKHYYFSLGRDINPVFENVPCNAMVVKIGAEQQTDQVESVLIPTGGGSPKQTLLSLDVAKALLTEGGTVTLWSMKRPDQSDRDIANTLRPYRNYGESLGIKVEQQVVEPGNVAKAIISSAANHQLLILGASRPGMFTKSAFGEIPEQVAQGTTQPVIMVKSPVGVQSFINRWLGR